MPPAFVSEMTSLVGRIIWFGWLILKSIMSSIYNHAAAYVKMSFLLKADYYSVIQICHNLSIHLWVDTGVVSTFWLL